jgi:DNA topoisomerase-1
MAKSLVIVESPSKAKTINKYLGKDYLVEASVGHIKNLPKSKLSVDIEKDFEVVYETMETKKDVVERLRKHAEKAKEVFIATDPDREGEAIAAHIADELEGANGRIKRVLFHEITETGIQEGMSHPRPLHRNMVMSQQARRAMDRIVGYKISPFVWKTVFYGLSAGRVQSVALRLICEREEAIRSFNPVEYWSLIGEFETPKGERFLAKLAKDGKADPTIPNEAAASALMDRARASSFLISSVTKRPVKRNPPPPFITSTLQQEAARRLRFSAKRTMTLAQKLYEGVDLGGEEGLTGLITYMRTDSTRLSDEAVSAVREYIYENYGKEYLPKEPRLFKKKGKSTQDAHEAIRPTSVKHTPKAVKHHLDKDLFALYELIWNRFIACQMSPAEFEAVSVDVSDGTLVFRATDQMPVFRGFLTVFDDTLEEDAPSPDETDPTSKLPEGLAEGLATKLTGLQPRQHFTKPPARFTESSLVKELESLGIGRPSTYAMIVSTVIDRKYVDQKERRLYATDLGMQVNKILVEHFPNVFNVRFTAQMEKELDTIATGKNDYLTVMRDFYEPFSTALEKASALASSIKKSLQEKTDIVCENCGRPMIIKWGRNGRFMACTGYPTCKTTKPLAEEQERMQHVTGEKCELCGGEMVVKGGRFGTFLGCSNYPSCKNTKPITTGITCPKCGKGDLVERKTKKGKRTFYGCTKYPECDFASWDKPVNESCPACGNPYLVEKFTQSKGAQIVCPSCKTVREPRDVALPA